MAQIRLSRVYDHEPHPARTMFLVERLWPRGLRRDAVELDGWCKDSGDATLLSSSRDVGHNNAVVLHEYLRNRRPALRQDPQGDPASAAC